MFTGRSTHLDLGEALFDPVVPASFPKSILRFRNQRWAERMGLGALDESAWRAHFGAFEPLPDSLPQPLALRYHGHQFRQYNPDLGDGRGFLFAQAVDPVDSCLRDFGTKGSGTTPWSRQGDGRLTLKGAMRELLATELLEALGVDTSKTFSVIETGEALQRHDEPSPTRSAVLVRLSHSHIRIGSFQRLAALGHDEVLVELARHSARHYLDELDAEAPSERLAPDLVAAVARRTATTAAAWMAAGFVHGVLNSDNINITGESFDYGPWRFLPHLDLNFTAAYFDHTGLYCYGRQPEAVLWNVCRLAECFGRVASVDDLRAAAEVFEPTLKEAMEAHLARRLGIGAQAGGELRLAERLLPALEESASPFEQFFFDHFGGVAARGRIAASPCVAAYSEGALGALSAELQAVAPADWARPEGEWFTRGKPETLLIEEVEALWSCIDAADDWQPLEDKVRRIREMGDAVGEGAG